MYVKPSSGLALAVTYDVRISVVCMMFVLHSNHSSAMYSLQSNVSYSVAQSKGGYHCNPPLHVNVCTQSQVVMVVTLLVRLQWLQ